MIEQPHPWPNDPHLRAVSEVLLDLSLDIEAMGTTLCADPDFVERHVHQLQLIDLVAQKQRSLATLLRADCPKNAMAEICLDDLRARLSQLVELADLVDDTADWDEI
jgi:aspartate ammonia-lyase